MGSDPDQLWEQYWRKIVSIKSHHYDLPSGAVGREFVDLMAEEVTLLNKGSATSEHLIVFISVMLQRDTMIRKGVDIRRLLKRRIETWRKQCYDQLLHEFVRCAKQWSKSHSSRSENNKDNVFKIFSRLMLRGEVKSAVRWLTERAFSGGILHPSQLVNGGPKSVLDIL